MKTIDQISKEVKTKISKLGKEQLITRYNNGKFTTEDEIITARYYILNRGTSEAEIADVEKYYSQYLKEVPAQQFVEDAADSIDWLETMKKFDIDDENSSFSIIKFCEYHKIPKELGDLVLFNLTNKEKIQKIASGDYDANFVEKDFSDSAQKTLIPNNAEFMEFVKEKSTEKEEKKEEKITTPVEKPKKDKKEKEKPIVKLTEQEFKLFEKIKFQSDSKIEIEPLQKEYSSLREFKGILGSLMKKKIVTVNGDSIKILKLGMDMISGKMPYKEKTKYEQNFFSNKRKTVEINGKMYEKSSYVRHLLSKNKNFPPSCKDLNEELAKIGFEKLYYSELKRCKEQLGIKK